MNAGAERITHGLLADLDFAGDLPRAVSIEGEDPVLPTRFRIGEAASAVLAACGVVAAELHGAHGGQAQNVAVDVNAACASLLSFALLRARDIDVARDAARPSIAAYATRDDRWIHLHGGFPHLRDGLLSLLECEDDHASIAAAVRRWDAFPLEDAIAEHGLCAAVARSRLEWESHPQGLALADHPLVEVLRIADSPAEPLPGGERPLSGLRVLDLTRVLAGPTCARTLAEHGAEVLRIGASHLPHIPGFAVDTGHGKRSAFLDLRSEAGVATLRSLASGADVFSQGYRAGSVARRGFGPDALAALRPGIVSVSINCYGHTGPWAGRPGWEQLAQTATGIAFERRDDTGAPRLLPAAATDYTTGYLGALGTLIALHRRAREGGSYHVRVSLSRTAMWLSSMGRVDAAPRGLDRDRLTPYMIQATTGHGPIEYLGPVLRMSQTPPRWLRQGSPLGQDAPEWSPQARALAARSSQASTTTPRQLD